MTKAQLEKKLRFWQELLRLQDWDIDISFAHHHDIDGFGHVFWTQEKKKATINITFPNEMEGMSHKDPEKTLVHELLHLHFSTTCRRKDGSFEDKIQDASIDQVAIALLKLYRRKRIR